MSQPEFQPVHDAQQIQRELLAARAHERHTRAVTSVRHSIMSRAPQLGSMVGILQDFRYVDSKSTRVHNQETVEALSVLPGSFDHPHVRYTLNRMLKGGAKPKDPNTPEVPFIPDSLEELVSQIGHQSWGQYSQAPQEQTARVILVAPTHSDRYHFDVKNPAAQKWVNYQLTLPNNPVVETAYVLGANGACIDYQTVYNIDAEDVVTRSSIMLSDGATLNPHGVDPQLFEQRHASWHWFAEHFTDHVR